MSRRWGVLAGGVVLVSALVGAAGPASAATLGSKTQVSDARVHGKATTLALGSNCGVSFGRGDLYIADGPAIRKVGPTDWLSTPLGQASQAATCGVALDHSGNIVFCNTNNNTIQVLAEKTGTFYGQAMTAKHIYTVAGTGRQGISQSGVVATQAELSGPGDVAVDRNGNLVFTDNGFKHQPVGTKRHYGAVVQVVAVKSGTFYHHKMIAGDIYTVAGHYGGPGDSGEGGLATRASLGRHLGELALDRSGNIVIGAWYNNRVEFVAEKSGSYFGQAMADDHIYSVAGTGAPGYSGDGGPGTSAEFNEPWGVAADGSGNVVIADFNNNRVRVLAGSTGTFYGQAMTSGHVYTVVGTGVSGFAGDGGPAAQAKISWPISVAVTPSGGLIVDDYNNERDRYVPAGAGTFFGQPMKAGDIYTIAGNGHVRTP